MSHFVSRLGWRLLRRGQSSRVGLPVLLVVTLLAATYVFLGQQSLTGEESRADELGDYSASAFRLNVEIPPGDGVTTRATAELENRNLDVDLALVVPDFPLNGIAVDGVYYRELAWDARRLDETIRMIHGRLPGAPGEVAVLGSVLGSSVGVGDVLDAPGAPDALHVVGVGESELREREELLAAEGTWASLPARRGVGEGIGTGVGMYVHSADPTAAADEAAVVLAEQLEGYYIGDAASFASDWARALRTAEQVAADPDETWVSRSPLSFWVPCLLLLPLVLLACHAALGRRLVPAARNAIRAGVSRRSVVMAAWVGVHLQLLVWGVLGLVAGIGVGWLATNLGLGGSIWLGWRSLWPLVFALVAGWAIGAALAVEYWLLRTQSGQRTAVDVGRPWLQHVRHVLAMVAVAAAVIDLREIAGPEDSLRASLFLGVAAALLAPDLTDLVASAMARGSASRRLSGRLLAANRGRAALLLACVTVLFLMSTGFLTALASFAETERERTIPPAPAGTVALDNDDSPALPVPRYVRTTAESVDVLEQQSPVQMWATGKVERGGEIVHIEHAAGTLELPGISFAVETVSDATAVLGRNLTGAERRALEASEVLVIDDRVTVTGDGAVELIDNTSGAPIAKVAAQRAAPAAASWLISMPTLMLVSTAQEFDVPLTRGALIYTGVEPPDALRVLEAMTAAGINPEVVETPQPVPALVPPAALMATAVALALMLIGALTSMLRAQLASMRPWASRLQQLGLSVTWTQRVFARECAALIVVGVVVGVGCGFLPIAVMAFSAPDFPVPFPAVEILTLTAVMLCTLVAVVYMGTRQLSAIEAVNWRDIG